MNEKTPVAVIKKKIGDTVYIIENVISENAKETAYDKVRRLVLKDTEIYQSKSA